MKVLIVEDCHFTQRIIQLHLQKHGYQIMTCCNGKQALDVLKDDPAYDLILSDIVMPVMGGLELLAEVKSTASLQSIPFMVLSGQQGAEIVQQAARMGCCGYILKPINPGIMMEQVRKITGQDVEWAVSPSGSYASKSALFGDS